MKDSPALFSLLSHPGISSPIARQLIHQFGSAEEVFNRHQKNRSVPDGVRKNLWQKINVKNVRQKADDNWKKFEKNKVQYMDFRDEDFPIHLNHIYDGPLLLFYKGERFPKATKTISIVGTRTPTKDALSLTEKFIDTLKIVRPIIVSGLAEGIDICAHRAALNAGLKTYACLAHGVTQCYPSFHQKTKSKIEQQGGCLTEHALDSTIHHGYFIRRTRIIAGLSHATIVMSSRLRGGAMVTARMAFDYNRTVFAVPGTPNYPTHLGCNQLIKRDIAHLLDNPEDVLKIMGWSPEPEDLVTRQTGLFQTLNEEQKTVLECLNQSPKHIDLIALEGKCPVGKAASLLFELEMMGLVRPMAGKHFKKC